MIFLSQPYVVFLTHKNAAYRVASDPAKQIAAVQEGFIGREICLPILGIIGAISLFRRTGEKLSVRGITAGIMVFFFLWACLSVVWADDTMLTAKRLLVLILLCLGALAIAKHFSLLEITEAIFVSGALTAVISLVQNCVMGTFHPLDPQYRFGGAMHPNDQGICFGLFFLSAIALAERPTRKRCLYFFTTIIALIFLILTKSRAAFLSAVFAVSIYKYLRQSRKAVIGAIMFIIICICVSYLLLGDDLLSYIQKGLFLGRTNQSVGTLNSRLPLWQECAMYFSRRPIFGYGYNAFWTAHHYARISADLDWGMGSAHNGYIDLILGVGVVGAGAFIIAMILAIVKAGALSMEFASSDYAIACAILIYILLSNLFESVLLLPHMATFFLYTLLLKIGFVKYR